METTYYLIGGMRCEGCAANVERAAKSVPGVDNAKVTLSENKLCVTGTSGLEKAILSAVREAGFDAALWTEQ